MIKGTVQKAKKTEFKLPNLVGIAPSESYPDFLRTAGTFVGQVTKVKAHISWDDVSSIFVEFVIKAIDEQFETEAYDRDAKKMSGTPAVPHQVGDKACCRLIMGQKFQYGEREWAGFLEACGLLTEEERNAAQEEILGEDNPLGEGGMLVRIKNVQKDSGYLNPYFSAYNAEAKSA